MVQDWVTEDAPLSLLDAYLEAIGEALGLDQECPDGCIDELQSNAGLVAFGIDRSEGVAAFRWSPARGGVVDTACVKVGEQHVRLLVSERLDSPCTVELRDLLEQKLLHTLRPARRKLPGFLALTALLSSQGRAVAGVLDLQREVQDSRAEADYYKLVTRELSEELRQARSSLKTRALPIEAVGFAHLSDTAAEPVAQKSFAWSDVAAWAASNEARITLLPRALAGCKKALYEEPAHALAGLEFLAGPYRDNRLGLLAKDQMQAALEESGLKLAGSTTASVAGSQGDEYFVSWSGRRRFLEFHLLRGGGRDERYCLRIYFFWCDETQRVVVGSLPAHLSNSLS